MRWLDLRTGDAFVPRFGRRRGIGYMVVGLELKRGTDLYATVLWGDGETETWAGLEVESYYEDNVVALAPREKP